MTSQEQELLTRVADAIAKGIAKNLSPNDIASAAIEAMVEPTCEMLAAGAKEVGNVSSSFLESGDAWVGDPKDVWQAMLRSSLKADEPRTGFLSTLTPDQRTEALKGFDGDDTLGNPVSLKGEGE